MCVPKVYSVTSGLVISSRRERERERETERQRDRETESGYKLTADSSFAQWAWVGLKTQCAKSVDRINPRNQNEIEVYELNTITTLFNVFICTKVRKGTKKKLRHIQINEDWWKTINSGCVCVCVSVCVFV